MAGTQAANAIKLTNAIVGQSLFHITDFLVFFIRASSSTGKDVGPVDYVPLRVVLRLQQLPLRLKRSVIAGSSFPARAACAPARPSPIDRCAW